MPPAESQLSRHVPAQRHLLLDDSSENSADVQARDDIREPGEQPQITRKAFDSESQQDITYGSSMVR